MFTNDMNCLERQGFFFMIATKETLLIKCTESSKFYPDSTKLSELTHWQCTKFSKIIAIIDIYES